MPQKLVTSPAVIGSFSTGSTGMICHLMSALCRSIVEAHGGRIWAARNDPQGVALHIMLPTLGDDRPE
jgi:signal transduction histidine kinase